jgi:hypothetical protein
MNKGRNNMKLNEVTNISPDALALPMKVERVLVSRVDSQSRTRIKDLLLQLRTSSCSPIIQKREFHQNVKARNRIGPHNVETLSVIFGSLLGNGKMKRLVEGNMLVIRESNKEYAQ